MARAINRSRWRSPRLYHVAVNSGAVALVLLAITALRLNNYTTSGNLNYRIPTGATTWVEPTAGFQYTISHYASGADQFGLADGTLLRLQGGARFGFEGAWNGVRMTTVVTGLLYVEPEAEDFSTRERLPERPLRDYAEDELRLTREQFDEVMAEMA